MSGVNGPDSDTVDVDLVTCRHLDHPSFCHRTDNGPEAARRDDHGSTDQCRERRPIKMVRMPMRYQDHVDRTERMDIGNRTVPLERIAGEILAAV